MWGELRTNLAHCLGLGVAVLNETTFQLPFCSSQEVIALMCRLRRLGLGCVCFRVSDGGRKLLMNQVQRLGLRVSGCPKAALEFPLRPRQAVITLWRLFRRLGVRVGRESCGILEKIS